MSENLNSAPQNEEVDLGQLFNMIGKVFKDLFNFIKNVANSLFKVLIYSLKPLVENIKIISIILALSTIFGYVYEKVKNDIYVSEMIVKPYFDSKYQLINNIEYFNSLIAENNQNRLSSIFEIDDTESRSLVEFSIEIAPETKNQLLQEYSRFLETLDSTLATTVTYKDFVNNRNILNGSMFKVTAKSEIEDIFPKLESGFSKSFQNQYSQKNKKLRDSSIFVQRLKLQRDLKRVDSIQRIYIDVLKTDTEKQTAILPSGAIPLTQEKSKTREYELLQEEIKIRNELKDLDKALITQSDFYDIISSFRATGEKDNSWLRQYKILFPAGIFLLLILGFIVIKAFNFIKDYE